MKHSKEHINLAKLIIESDPAVCKSVLKSVNSGFIHFLGEIGLNILLENITLTGHYLSKLQSHSQFIRDLGSKRIKLRRRRKLCLEHHKIVQLLLKAVISNLESF